MSTRRILIVEDELPAAHRLQGFVREYLPDAEIVGPVASVGEAVRVLKSETFDLVFLDIHLSDGHSFEIFRETEVSSPVIFITAFDEHALEAFRHNGIDYLLKPLKKAELERALDKYTRFFGGKNDASQSLQALADMLNKARPEKKVKRLMVRYGSKIKMVDPDELAYVASRDKIAYLTLFTGETLPSDFTMDELEAGLDPNLFFRISRQMLVNLKAVEDMTVFSKSRLKLSLSPPCLDECLVSAERTPSFKAWLTGKG